MDNHGSAAIEATLILPIFIMTAMAFYFIGHLLQVRLVVYDAMQDTIQYFAEYQYISENLKENAADAVKAVSMSAPVVKAKIQEYLKASPVDDSCLVGGIGGIVITRSSYSKADGCINIKLHYKLKLDLPVFGKLTWNVNEQIQQKAFIGMITNLEQGPDQAYVYITDTGDVYHTSRTCYHIRLQIRQINHEALKTSYSALTPCELCAENRSSDGNIYITETGDRFHYSLSCSGLKRTVLRIKKQKIEHMPACSNCGGM